MRLLLIIILFPSLLLGQDSTSTDHSFSFNFGVNVDVYFGNRYSPPDPKAAPDGGVFGGSTGHSVFSFEGGGYYSYSITKYLFIQAGIQYFNRKGYSTSNPDSVIKYTPNSPYWKPTIERKYSDHNIDIPLLMGINYKRFSILAGIRSNVISYKIT